MPVCAFKARAVHVDWPVGIEERIRFRDPDGHFIRPGSRPGLWPPAFASGQGTGRVSPDCFGNAGVLFHPLVHYPTAGEAVFEAVRVSAQLARLWPVCAEEVLYRAGEELEHFPFFPRPQCRLARGPEDLREGLQVDAML
jgi:hypothetical protein